MSVRQFLETNFPAGSTELSSPQDTVSAEGFLDRFRGRSSGKSDPSVADHATRARAPHQWMKDKLFKSSGKGFTLKEGAITIGPRYAPLFKRGSGIVDNVPREARKDLIVYQRVFTKVKPTLDHNGRYLNTVTRALDHFMANDPQATKPEEFIELLKQLDAKAPKTTLVGFTEPNYPFLGFDRQRFTDKDGFVGEATPRKSEEIQLPALDAKQFEELTKVLMDLDKLYQSLESLEESLVSVGDLSDPPFRAYVDVIVDAFNVELPYLHPTFDHQNSDLVTRLGTQVGWLINGIAVYLKQCTK